MKISELIEQLKNYPSDMRVIIHGYEGGYDDINYFKEKEIILNANEPGGCEGVHDFVSFCDDREADETALLISTIS